MPTRISSASGNRSRVAYRSRPSTTIVRMSSSRANRVSDIAICPAPTMTSVSRRREPVEEDARRRSWSSRVVREPSQHVAATVARRRSTRRRRVSRARSDLVDDERQRAPSSGVATTARDPRRSRRARRRATHDGIALSAGATRSSSTSTLPPQVSPISHASSSSSEMSRSAPAAVGDRARRRPRSPARRRTRRSSRRR